MLCNAQTKLYAMVGSPIRHSLSPLFYNYFFQKYGLNQICLAFDVNEGQAKDIIRLSTLWGVEGISVTMPLKSIMAQNLNHLTLQAETLQAVNAIKIVDKETFGYNTDGKGLVTLLENNGFAYIHERVVMSGLGGAGRAIALELILGHVGELIIAVQDQEREQAEQFLHALQGFSKHTKLQLISTDEDSLLQALNEDTSVFINCTPVGMHPATDKSLIEDFRTVPSSIDFVDIVYSPLQTKLLLLAKANGNRIANGIDMLLHQAGETFGIWTGIGLKADEYKEIMQIMKEEQVIGI